MSPVILAGLLAPAAVAVLTAVAALAFGVTWALGTLAVGSAALVAFHLWHLGGLASWAAGPLDAAVPEGRGSWRVALSALYRRVRIRNQLQQDLVVAMERFRSVAEAIPDGMVVLDASNRVQWANTRAQMHLGLDLGHDTGQPLVNVVRQPDFIRYLDTGDYSDAVVVDSQREPGATLSIQVIPFGVEEKLLISRDITQLEAVARMRRDFIADVSHEMKTPLTVVAGYIETLQDMELEPRQRKLYLALMQEQATSMQRLVDDLLALSALESDQRPRAEAEFAVVPVLLELAADARALSGGQHTVAVDSGDGAAVTGNRDELASACRNLVSNAIRYTPAGGTVTLRWRIAPDGWGEFGVEDTGIGIAAEHIPRLTERFYRVDRSRSRATGGTGLGLAIVKHVVLRHQAELDVVSEPGAGSTFTVRLPPRRVRRVVAESPSGLEPTAAPTSS
jgi:two-component system phosphate regulon sensor histidine kinase PhoR